jgi:DNA-directed RNA polymerase subunit N (RpoN/RPB10)
MIIPVRCFTCGYPVARQWDEFSRRESGLARIQRRFSTSWVSRGIVVEKYF